MKHFAHHRHGTLLAIALAFALADRAALAADAPVEPERLPADARITSVEILPATIELTDRFDYRQLLVTGALENGERIDLTRLVRIEAPDELVRISPTGLVRPVGDGQGALRLSIADHAVDVPVAVRGAGSLFVPSYVQDVAPAMSKLGCNAGTCHGSAQGKNGFKLSLRGYDPQFDFRALVDDLAGRRFNRAAPDQSLMLLKPSGGVPHEGGVLMHPGEPYYEILRAWIADGVQLDLDAPRVASIEVHPAEALIPLPGMKQQVVVIATYADGSRRDVTAEAFVESSLTETLTVDKSGLAVGVRRGEAALLARYEGAYAAARVVVMGDRSGFEWSNPPEYNDIDALVYDKLESVRILPSDVCSDGEFIRRVYLDLTGLPPTKDRVRAFLDDSRDSRQKRDELVDRLIDGPEFIEHWTNKWADLLQVNRKFLGEEGAWTWRNWIRQALSDNMPYDQFCRSVLTASGSTLENPPAAYFKVLREPGLAMENTTQLFLGIRFNCNKCHDHPFERWTQDQYYDMAAYFAQVGRKPHPAFAGQNIGGSAVEQPLPLVEIIYDSGAGEVTHERTGAVTPPSFPYEFDGYAHNAPSRREQLADWITSANNPYFAKSYVNRIWSYLFGMGLIEPIDDIRAGNPPSNPELLDRLTSEFIAGGFNVRELFRKICKSRTYQHALGTNRWNEDDEVNFSHALARRLPAETLYDAVHVATGSKSKLPGLPEGYRASETADSAMELTDGFLQLFGRPPRESACECERSTGVMLSQALNLVNGPTIAEAVSDPDNAITRLVAAEPVDRRVIEELFVSILCRPPTEHEAAAAEATIAAARDELAEVEAAVAAFERDELPARQAAWERTVAPAVWTALDGAIEVSSAGGAELARLDDGSILVHGKNPEKDTLRMVFDVALPRITAVRLELLPHESLTKGGPGRSAFGNLVLSTLAVTAAPADQPDAATPLKFGDADATYSQPGYPAAAAVDADPATGWAIADRFNQPSTALFRAGEAVEFSGPVRLVVTLDQQFGTAHTIGRFRLAVTDATGPVTLTELPTDVTAALVKPTAERTEAERATVAAHFRTLDPDWKRLSAMRDTARAQHERYRLTGAQDIAWALINSPAFLFNR